jgi:hypothetical protein
LVVPKESSSLGDPEESAETIEANYHTMCEFHGVDDPGYVQVGCDDLSIQLFRGMNTELLEFRRLDLSVLDLHNVRNL